MQLLLLETYCLCTMTLGTTSHNRFKAFFWLRTLRPIDWFHLGAKASERHNKVGRYRLGYNYNLFPAFKGWTQDQLSIGRHPLKDLKWTELCLGPIQTRLEVFLGFLVKTKMKAYKKLTVTCCQIVARKSLALSSGNFRRQPAPRYACGEDQEFWRKKVLEKLSLHVFCSRCWTSASV